ncbi:polysaccharide deacetylase family protein [Hymenobacter psoromatis]|uniref:polysaccharide deacetylase family protein n=1 Tax=Hymenobacter psoromatis TaxID=1484116 RepID=UPI001CBECA24|nr:polysaccharide deacetylase family protein [Hymenobacter psoromatis]
MLFSNPLTRPPAWLHPLFPGSEWRGAPAGPTGRPRLYLTFDDGPVPDETPWVLAQLAAYGARATFFCVGDNLARYPEITRATLAAGHRLGNHTQHHRSAWNTPRAAYLASVAECEGSLELARRSGELIRLVSASTAIGNTVTAAEVAPPSSFPIPNAAQLFRPPYGRLTWPLLRALRAREYRVVMWSLLTRDYDPGLPPERALRLTLAATRPGDIVVLHDSRKASRSLRFLLPQLLAYYTELGYELAAL